MFWTMFDIVVFVTEPTEPDAKRMPLFIVLSTLLSNLLMTVF